MSKQSNHKDTKPDPQKADKHPPSGDNSKAKPVQFEDELPGELGHQILDM
ncbi:hypothetical protein [Yersinia intermedia]|nr:hypothetical protein [Yersinia intermedia]CRY83974.1 Uncharacterised protein [Yersinia intermedia]